MTEISPTCLKRKQFYERNYVYLKTPSYLRPDTPKIVLGDRENRVCRFCDQSEPEVSFQSKAHAICECLGNKSLFTEYECDGCNQRFGRIFENDLGNWSIVTRALAGIRGKKRIPVVKESGSQSGLRVTRNSEGLVYTESGDASIVILDEENKRVRFNAKRYTYTPTAVLKAFVKIGLTLLPDDEVENFSETISWIRNVDHSTGFFRKCPVIDTFVPGPSWGQLIITRLLRRKPHSNDVPYIFLVLGFANHLFQVWLPCRSRDELIWNKTLDLPPFMPIKLPNSNLYGDPVKRIIDLNGHEAVSGESDLHTLSFESMETNE